MQRYENYQLATSWRFSGDGKGCSQFQGYSASPPKLSGDGRLFRIYK
ncbi:MAG: hypothetical protein WBC65_08115 [Ignavibacteria bacterium]